MLPCRKSKFGIRLSPALRGGRQHIRQICQLLALRGQFPFASFTRLSTEVSAVASAFFDTLLLVVFRLFCRFVSWLALRGDGPFRCTDPARQTGNGAGGGIDVHPVSNVSDVKIIEVATAAFQIVIQRYW
ncbi:hypothetical protein AM486_28920 (plasmid) [Klebsiella pneumoniae]|nr:hypothetical protein AM486_28920 [Klebsiella pneumoniae]